MSHLARLINPVHPFCRLLRICHDHAALFGSLDLILLCNLRLTPSAFHTRVCAKQAIDWWETSASEAVAGGAHAEEALRMLERACGLADALADYYRNNQQAWSATDGQAEACIFL